MSTAIEVSHEWSLRETFAMLVGVLGLAVALPTLVPLTAVGTAIVIVVEAVLMIGLFLYLPPKGMPWRHAIVALLVLALGVAVPFVLRYWFAAPFDYERDLRYDPFTYDGRVKDSLTIVKQESGDCKQSLNNSNRIDASRCFGQTDIFDPCFAPPLDGAMICVEGPWSTTAVALTDTSTEVEDRTVVDKPWAIELVGGRKCVFSGGGGGPPVRAGERLDYNCYRDDKAAEAGNFSNGEIWLGGIFGVDLESGTARLSLPDKETKRTPIVRTWR